MRMRSHTLPQPERAWLHLHKPMAVAVGRGVPEAVRLSLLRGRAWVSGRWVEAASKQTFPVWNPANGEIIADVSGVRVILWQFSYCVHPCRSLTWVLQTLRRPLRLHIQHSAAGRPSPARYRPLIGHTVMEGGRLVLRVVCRREQGCCGGGMML